jgi:hypothetical protein
VDFGGWLAARGSEQDQWWQIKKGAVMKRQHLPFYAIATAILIVELVAFGVPASSLFLLAFVFVCPLMMLVMMRPMHSGSSQDNRPGRSSHGGSGSPLPARPTVAQPASAAR